MWSLLPVDFHLRSSQTSSISALCLGSFLTPSRRLYSWRRCVRDGAKLPSRCLRYGRTSVFMFKKAPWDTEFGQTVGRALPTPHLLDVHCHASRPIPRLTSPQASRFPTSKIWGYALVCRTPASQGTCFSGLNPF